MARQSLGDLLGNLEDATPAVDASGLAPAAFSKPAQAAKLVSESAASAPPLRPKLPERKPVDELPTYLRLVRKETRLREDQQNQLTLQARRLNRAKAAGTPRITDNTLIRIAVDLLLDHVDGASGDDEAALLASIRGRRS